MKKVSVIIPCYNQAQFLPETVESILAQTYPAYESSPSMTRPLTEASKRRLSAGTIDGLAWKTPGMSITARRYRLITRHCCVSILSAHHASPCFAVTSFNGSEASNPAWRGRRTKTLYFRITRTDPMHCHHAVIADRRHDKQESQNWGKMLTAAMKTLQRQQPFVQEDDVSADAYRHGITFRRRLYGELLF